MTLSELKKEIIEKSKQSKELHNKIANLHNQINSLRNMAEKIEMEEFVNYLQIDEVIELNNYYSFKGYCKDPKSTNSLQSGEKIKISKKNKKSIVIEVIEKHTKKWDEVQKRSVITGQFNPGWNIRVDLDSFYHFYLKNEIRKTAFESYIKRKEILEKILD
jgi:nucleoid DNA-binding protein